jgi:hypothetical protein
MGIRYTTESKDIEGLGLRILADWKEIGLYT